MDFVEREEGRGERETLMMREKHRLAAPALRLQGIEPSPRACALPGHRTGELLVRGSVLSPLSHTGRAVPSSLNMKGVTPDSVLNIIGKAA